MSKVIVTKSYQLEVTEKELIFIMNHFQNYKWLIESIGDDPTENQDKAESLFYAAKEALKQ